MVYISRQVKIDLEDIFKGMLEWEKFELSFEFVDDYVDEIVEQCYSLESKSYHSNSKYLQHKKFGSKVYRYRRNPQTTWYIIYDIDRDKNIFINKIISSHETKE